jgi:hypothetical protein
MFGFKAVNDYNQILFSDSSYVLEFVAKATWVRRYDIQTAGGTNTRFLNIFSEIKCHPLYIINEYTINIPNTDLLAFSHVTFPSYTAILYQTAINSTTTRLLVVGQLYEQPQVYCFRKIVGSSGGYGIKVFDAAGAETFSTNTRTLIPRAASNISVTASPWFVKRYSVNNSYYFAANNGNENLEAYYDNALIGPATAIAKPAINFHSQMSAVVFGGGGTNSIKVFCEPGVRYNSSSQTLQLQHGVGSGQTSIPNAPEVRVPAHNVFTMVIDGAYYD